jgi:hypothetical protein
MELNSHVRFKQAENKSVNLTKFGGKNRFCNLNFSRSFKIRKKIRRFLEP